MNPFYFGESERALYGVYHPPRSARVRETGVVLCYPIGQEYMRSHRAFRQLAMILAKKGFHVLRFDYFATGDSCGDGSEGSLEQWRADIGVAIDELKDTAGIGRVAVVGLRVGAALAVSACRDRDDVTDLVLWDPVTDGRAYIEELLTSPMGRIDGDGQAILAGRGGDRTVGVMGFPLTPAMRRGLDGIRLLEQPSPAVRSSAVLVSGEREDCKALRDRFHRDGIRSSYRCVPSPGSWNIVDNNGSVLIPQAIIQEVVARLTEARR